MKTKEEIEEAADKLRKIAGLGAVDPDTNETRSHHLGLYTALHWVLLDDGVSFPDFITSVEADAIRDQFLPSDDDESNSTEGNA